MKKIRICALVCGLLMWLSVLAVPTAAAGYTLPDGTDLHASAAILVSLAGDAEDDVVLFEKEADTVHAPASMMRYMVLAYALHRVEEEGMDVDAVTGKYTREMFNNHVAGTGVNTANMAFGETWTLRDLLQVSFMQSASDAVVVLAYTIDGGVAPFVDGMNALAAEIGCTYSHFANLTGLDSLSQYTTPRDMYRIMRYAQSFSLFESLTNRYQVTVKPTAGGSQRTIVSANSMLQPSSSFRYSPLVHSRTGLSEHEGRTCASVARDSGYEFLVVVMGCPEKNAEGQNNLHYRDTMTLFRWGFNNFVYKTVLGKGEPLASLPISLSLEADWVNLVPRQEIATVVEANLALNQIVKEVTLYKDKVEAPLEKGTVLGKVELIVNTDQKIGEVELVAAETINRSWLLYTWSQVAGFFTSVWFFVGVGVLVLLIIGYIVLNVVHNRRRRKNRMPRVKPR